jgi:hypothetical protein
MTTMNWVGVAVILMSEVVRPASAQLLSSVTRPGANVQRVMTLLQESTPQKRNTVRLLFYGQSITAGAWSKTVAEELKRRYPHANLIIENRAIGGFVARKLIQSAEYDLYPTYPDLLIFHVYGTDNEGMDCFEEIIRRTRVRTTAEILLSTNHDRGLPRDYRESGRIREIAVKYQCGLVDVERSWGDELARLEQPPTVFLADKVHPNKQGNALFAKLMGDFLRPDPSLPVGPSMQWVKEISGSDDHAVGREPDGAIEFKFTGNRIDASASRNYGTEAMAEVFVDGRRPSSFNETFVATRPSEAPFVWWPAFREHSHQSPLVPERWTLRVLESTADGKRIRFRVFGSVTKDDGEGVSTERFVSRSGRVVIEGGDNWGVAYALEYRKKTMPSEYQVTWEVVAQHADTLQFPPASAEGIETAVTLIQGLPNGTHTLRLVPRRGTSFAVKGFRVYRPPLVEEPGR